MQVKCKSKNQAETGNGYRAQSPNNRMGGIAMEQFLQQRIALCITRLSECADRPDPESVEQWHYWRGALAAYRNMLAQYETPEAVRK